MMKVVVTAGRKAATRENATRATVSRCSPSKIHKAASELIPFLREKMIPIPAITGTANIQEGELR